MIFLGNYISTGSIDNFSTGLDTTGENAIIDRVEERIEKITNDYFYMKDYHFFLNGNGKRAMFPPISPAIISVNYLSIAETEIATIDFSSTQSSGTTGAFLMVLTQSGINADFYKNDYLGIHSSTTTENYWGTRILSNTATSTGGTVTYTLEDALIKSTSTGDMVSLIENWDFDKFTLFRNKPASSLMEPGVDPEPWEFHLDNPFPKGKRNIEVKGSYGWRATPLDIEEAALIMVRHYNDGTLYTSYSYGMESEKLGEASYKRSSKKSLTGICEADELLEKYIRKKPLMMAV